jgi:hypothetical protein
MATIHDLLRVTDTDGDRWDPDDLYLWPRTVWMDPGVTSGVAVVWWDPRSIACGRTLQDSILAVAAGYLHGPEFKQVENFLELCKGMHGGKKGMTVGTETFRVLSISSEDGFLSPVRLRTAIHWDMYKRGRILYGQAPSEAKTAFPDDRLKEMGFYVPGPDHARDAVRHGLLHVKKMRKMSRDKLTSVIGHREAWWN